MIALQHTFERSDTHNLSISHAPDRRHARHLRFEDKPSPGFVHKHVMSFEMHWWKGCRGRALKACRKACRSYPRGRGPVLLPERKECLPDQGHLWATMQHLNLLAGGNTKVCLDSIFNEGWDIAVGSPDRGPRPLQSRSPPLAPARSGKSLPKIGLKPRALSNRKGGPPPFCPSICGARACTAISKRISAHSQPGRRRRAASGKESKLMAQECTETLWVAIDLYYVVKRVFRRT